MNNRARSNQSPRAGFSVLEMMIAVAILSVLAGTLTLTIKRMRGLSHASYTQSQLQESAERSMRRIVADLSRSGALTVGAMDYPYFFVDGAVGGIHAHPPATHKAVAGDSDFGPTREIVFVLPQESDPPGTFGNDVPDIDANANLIWDVVEFSYVLVTGVDGINYLQRRMDGGTPVTIATNVERVTFDDSKSTGFVIPVDAVRVRLYFRKVDGSGTLHRCSVEQVIKLRNGI